MSRTRLSLWRISKGSLTDNVKVDKERGLGNGPPTSKEYEQTDRPIGEESNANKMKTKDDPNFTRGHLARLKGDQACKRNENDTTPKAAALLARGQLSMNNVASTSMSMKRNRVALNTTKEMGIKPNAFTMKIVRVASQHHQKDASMILEAW